MKTIIGKVVSTKMKDTLVVEVGRQRFHPMYKKIIRKSRRFKVHHQNSDVKLGDLVKIGSTKPISKEKHFILLEKLVRESQEKI